ncbi:hypothetical protein [Gleimia hominis]|uniref:Uncharacterized protein n=1 Tax=Gleimia hominis TaxID=595468 RepID=A0ABU3IB45_9ACTO|nr:hypothetical protein [Gleimia hominis]MDT3767595.1 hypothetical protein [Gleimia hominis]WIK65004.1 hypothetical protein CJ187_002835 [Gleimia hominis]
MKKFSIYDTHSGRQARNLFETSLSEAVRPWFQDMTNHRVLQAIDELAEPAKRGQAAAFLGLLLEPVA